MALVERRRRRIDSLGGTEDLTRSVCDWARVVAAFGVDSLPNVAELSFGFSSLLMEPGLEEIGPPWRAEEGHLDALLPVVGVL